MKISLENVNSNELNELKVTAHEAIAGIIMAIDPRDYKDNPDIFISLVLTCPVMIAVSIFEKIMRKFNLSTEEVFETFVEKMKMALKWEINKEDLLTHGKSIY